MLKLSVREYARDQVSEAAAYYLAISPELREEFLKSVLQAYKILQENPDMGSNRFAHLAKGWKAKVWNTNRFPFMIFHYADETTLHIVAVEHEKRNVTSRLLSFVKNRT